LGRALLDISVTDEIERARFTGPVTSGTVLENDGGDVFVEGDGTGRQPLLLRVEGSGAVRETNRCHPAGHSDDQAKGDPEAQPRLARHP